MRYLIASLILLVCAPTQAEIIYCSSTPPPSIIFWDEHAYEEEIEETSEEAQEEENIEEAQGEEKECQATSGEPIVYRMRIPIAVSTPIEEQLLPLPPIYFPPIDFPLVEKEEKEFIYKDVFLPNTTSYTISSGGGGGGSRQCNSPCYNAPPIVIPEPNSFLLALMGAAIGLWQWLLKKRSYGILILVCCLMMAFAFNSGGNETIQTSEVQEAPEETPEETPEEILKIQKSRPVIFYHDKGKGYCYYLTDEDIARKQNTLTKQAQYEYKQELEEEQKLMTNSRPMDILSIVCSNPQIEGYFPTEQYLANQKVEYLEIEVISHRELSLNELREKAIKAAPNMVKSTPITVDGGQYVCVRIYQ